MAGPFGLDLGFGPACHLDRRQAARRDADQARAGVSGIRLPAYVPTALELVNEEARGLLGDLGLAQTGVPAAAMALLRARGSVDRMIHDTAVRQARLPAERYPALLRAMVGSRKKAPGVSSLEPLIDVLVHGQDIAVPLRLDRRMPAPAAMAAADRVWPDLYPFRARRRLGGISFAATDCCWSAGEGLAAEGPIAAILLALTGRPAAVSQLSGPGVRELESRLAVPLKRVSC
jgi:hypothetical protein